MQNESKNKVLAVIFWILSGVCMGLIFWFSSREAGQSAHQSEIILKIVRAIFGENAFSDFIVRKTAHFCEFALLAFLFNFALLYTTGKKHIPLGIALTSLYAASDEFHQLFVLGRSCQASDWLLDTCGGAAGAIFFIVIFLIIKYIKVKTERTEKNECTHI